MSKNIIIIILFINLLNACTISPQIEEGIQYTSTPLSTATPEIRVTISPVPLNTPTLVQDILPTEVVEPMEQTISVPPALFQLKSDDFMPIALEPCLSTIASPTTNLEISNQYKGILVKNLNNSVYQIVNLGDSFLANFDVDPQVSISPNQNFFAVTTQTESQIFVSIFNRDLDTSFSHIFEVNHANPQGFIWLNDDALVLTSEVTSSKLNYLIWYPFQEKEEILDISLEGFEANSFYPLPDPTLSFIVYPCNMEDCLVSYHVLNIKDQKIIHSIKNAYFYNGMQEKIIWSNNGEYFAIFAKPYKEVAKTRLTIFSLEGFNLFQVDIPGYAGGFDTQWSPDNSKLLFRWGKEGENGQGTSTLALFDMEKKAIQDLCLQNVEKFFWSPSGEQIVIEMVEDLENQKYLGAVFDLSAQEIFQWYDSPKPNFVQGWVIE